MHRGLSMKAGLANLEGARQREMGFPSSLPQGAYPTRIHRFIRVLKKLQDEWGKRTRVSLESLPQLIPYPYLYSPRQTVSQCKMSMVKEKQYIKVKI